MVADLEMSDALCSAMRRSKAAIYLLEGLYSDVVGCCSTAIECKTLDAKDYCAREIRDGFENVYAALSDMMCAIVEDAESALSLDERSVRMDGCR